MRIALLGTDIELAELVRSFPSSTEYVATYGCDADLAIPFRNPVPSHPLSDWPTLLNSPVLDGVIVGGTDAWTEAGIDRIRQLMQAEIPLLLPWPDGDPLAVYELDMIRQSSGAVLAVRAAHPHHPALKVIQSLAGDPTDPLAWDQLIIERHLPDCRRTVLLRQFAIDCDLIRRVAGELQSVSASGVQPDALHWPGFHANLNAARAATIRWNLNPESSAPAFRMVLLRGSRRAIWTAHADLTNSQVELDRFDSPGFPKAWPDWNPAQTIARTFSSTLHGTAPVPHWTDLCRCAEVVDGVERSLTRGRRIDLTGRTVTEQDAFRGVMSAGGCFLILVGLLFLIVFATFEGARIAHSGALRESAATHAAGAQSGPRDDGIATRPTPYWAILLAVPLVAFLMMQLLQLLIRKPADRADSAEETNFADSIN